MRRDTLAMRNFLSKYAPILRKLQAYARGNAISIIKKRQRGHRGVAKDVRGEHLFTHLASRFLIAGVDGEQRPAFFDLLTHLVMNNQANGMVHRVRLFGTARTEGH